MSSGEASTRSRFLLGGTNPIFPVLPAGTLHGGLTILPRTSGFTGVRDVASSRRILLNKQEDEAAVSLMAYGPHRSF